jgi:hypothetical protein
MRLYPDRSNVHNWNYQDVHACQCNLHYPVECDSTFSYPVMHMHEWDKPLAQQLILEALGYTTGIPQYTTGVPQACLPQPGT